MNYVHIVNLTASINALTLQQPKQIRLNSQNRKKEPIYGSQMATRRELKPREWTHIEKKNAQTFVVEFGLEMKTEKKI